MITRADKEQQVKALGEQIAKARGAFIVDFKGMKVEQVTNLRKKLNQSESEMKVVRNTLAKRAFKDHPNVEKAFSSTMRGTNAIVFSYGEVNATAKVLVDFAKDVEVLQIKTGMMDGEALDEAKVKFLGTLPGKNEMRAMFLGMLQGPGSALARCLNEYAKKQGGGTEAAPAQA
ncbi:MAG: 50S ribosomal protein L10 [Bdellovibrionaceae bacterium]|nr:50S ribosomal protein L10 [Pseudobdellovibrionaceae bacterium]MBX3032438.1 50S ribosomal protein L10 [Pseudobdellovibrionaceae bacterium]